MSAPLPIVSTVQFGIAGASTAVTGNLTADADQFAATYVTLSEAYVQTKDPWTTFLVGTPGMAGGSPNTSRGSYANGARAQFWKVEALAIVAAGAGVLS
jgi:hypothetical protein